MATWMRHHPSTIDLTTAVTNDDHERGLCGVGIYIYMPPLLKPLTNLTFSDSWHAMARLFGDRLVIPFSNTYGLFSFHYVSYGHPAGYKITHR